jgi:hypothetical protein
MQCKRLYTRGDGDPGEPLICLIKKNIKKTDTQEVTMPTVAPAKESTLIQSDLGMMSQDCITSGKRRAEAEANPQQTRKSLRISGRRSSQVTEEGIIQPLEVSSRNAKGKSYKEVTDAQEAIMASIKEANATRGKTVSFSNIERLQSAAIWSEVETGPSTSRFVRTVSLEESRMRSESRDRHSSHVKRTSGRAQQDSSRSGPRSINYTSRSNTDWRFNKTEPMKLENAAEVVEVGTATRYALEEETNSSWANRTEPTEPGTVVEMAEAMAATRYAMEGEAKHMGARTAGSEFVEEANLDEIEEECHSDAQGRE